MWGFSLFKEKIKGFEMKLKAPDGGYSLACFCVCHSVST